MSPAKPVYLKTPDGVERQLRFTFGARKRIVDRFGMQLMDALNKYDVGALPELLYCLMYDEKGNPPEGLDPVQLTETLPLEDAPALMATLLQAASQGRAEKNELEALIRERMQAGMESLIGSTSGALPTSASGAGDPISGNSQNGNSTHSLIDTTNSEPLTTTEPV